MGVHGEIVEGRSRVNGAVIGTMCDLQFPAGAGLSWSSFFAYADRCRILDACINPKRYPFFMASAILKELIEPLPFPRPAVPQQHRPFIRNRCGLQTGVPGSRSRCVG